MAVIWKFRLPMRSESSIEMPQGAHVLSIQDQRGELFVWAIVPNPKASDEKRKFFIVGTGLDVPEAIGNHVATVQQGPYVWHVFEDPRA